MIDPPYTTGFAVLCVFQGLAVLGPRVPPPPRSRRLSLLGLVPVAAVGGAVFLIGATESGATRAAALSALVTPPAAIATFWTGRYRLFGLVAAVAYVLAWRAGGDLADIAADVVICLACASWAWLTAVVAPRGALAIGLFIATGLDVYQVVATEDVAQVSAALAAAPATMDLPKLVEATFQGASMGYGDLYAAALLGVVIARWRERLIASVALVLVGLVFGFAFAWLDLLPALVPVAVVLGAVLIVCGGLPRYPSDDEEVPPWSQLRTRTTNIS